MDDNLEDGGGHGFFESSFMKGSARAARWAQPITYLHIYLVNSNRVTQGDLTGCSSLNIIIPSMDCTSAPLFTCGNETHS
jgi:hypothetical protein